MTSFLNSTFANLKNQSALWCANSFEIFNIFQRNFVERQSKTVPFSLLIVDNIGRAKNFVCWTSMQVFFIRSNF